MKEGLKGMEKDKEEAKKLKAQDVGWLTRSSTWTLRPFRLPTGLR